MTNPPLVVKRDGPVVYLTLNRPDRGNSLSSLMVDEITQAVRDACAEETSLLVIFGAGQNFCTGLDLSDLESQSDDLLLARLVRIELMLQQVNAAPFATIAVAKGRVMGAGADLFAACESRWVVDNASFAFPGAGFGVVLGTSRLAALVGVTRARELVGSGRLIDAPTALQFGLASAHYKAQSEIDAELQQLISSLRRLSTGTHAAIRAVTLTRGSDGQALDLAALVASAARPGIKSRIAAYLESGRKAYATAKPESAMLK